MAAHAAALFQAGWGKWILFTGGFGTGPHSGANLLGWTKPEAQIFADEAVRLGVPPDAIIVENSASNSGENILFSRRQLRELGLKSDTLIVSGVSLVVGLHRLPPSAPGIRDLPSHNDSPPQRRDQRRPTGPASLAGGAEAVHGAKDLRYVQENMAGAHDRIKLGRWVVGRLHRGRHQRDPRRHGS